MPSAVNSYLMQDASSTIRILSMVEATTINAVAKNVLEFYRSARQLRSGLNDFPNVEGSVVTFDRTSDSTEPPNDFVRAARESGIEVDMIHERRRFDFSVIPALRRVVETRSPDIIVSHSVKSHFLVWRSRVWQQIPWVGFHHGYTTTDLKMRLFNQLDRWSLPMADRIITVCHAFARELTISTGLPIERIAVQHNSIRRENKTSVEEGQSLRSQLGISNDELLILSVGRLSREKGHMDLLAAFDYLLKTPPGFRGKLVIVGEGPERGKLEATVESLGLKRDVLFAGQTGNVQPFYVAADVLVLPSHSEGSSNVLLEAMAADLPIVATAVGGVPEMVEDNNSALLVPAGDLIAMVAAIKRVLEDKQLAHRLTANASLLAAERYSPDSYALALINIYRLVARSRG